MSWSGDRQKNADGKVPAVGNTVDIETASYSNSIGAPILSGYWKDPDFDPDQHAFYYVRVLEIPTPNWTTYDHVYLGVDLAKKQCHINRSVPTRLPFGTRPKRARMPDPGPQRLKESK